MSLEKRRLVMKVFVNSQFGYCPLIWMFHNRTLNNGINRIHEQALRIVYRDFPVSTYAYNVRSTYEFKLENVKTVHYGTESLPFLGPKIWELVPLELNLPIL